MIEKILLILVLVSAFPLGYLLAWLCRDELKAGRIYFRILEILSIILMIFIFFLNINFKLKASLILSLFFIILIILISKIKSYDKKFIK